MDIEKNTNINKKIIEAIKKVIGGDNDVKVDFPENDTELNPLIEALNGLFRYVAELNNRISKPEKRTGMKNSVPEINSANSDESLLLTRYIIDKASEAIYGLDSSSRIIYANDAAISSLGYTKDEFVDKSIFDIDPNIKQDKWEEHWKNSMKNKFLLIESEHRRKNGETFPVEIAIDFFSFGGKEYHSSFVRNITESKKAEEKLLLTQYAFDTASLGIIRLGTNGKILGYNNQFRKNLGYTSEELLDMYIWEIDPIYNQKKWKEHRNSLRLQKSKVFESVHKRKDGSVFPVEITANYRIFNGSEFSWSFIKDLSEQKKAQYALEQSEQLLKESQRVAMLGHYIFEADSGKWNGSEILYDILGIDESYNRDIESWLNIVHPDFTEIMKRYLKVNILSKFEKFDMEYKIIRPDNKNTRWVHGLGELKFDSNHNVIRMIGTIRDITEAKQAEEKLKSSLNEKEVLIKELYHRTKNNMQVIRAMLAIQSSHVNDEEVKKKYFEMENRILTMSLVHQKLYQSNNLSSIDLKEYIEDLIELLMKSYNVNNERITVKLQLENISALIDTAIPCGLLLNELLSNSFKHAFPNNIKGEINISLTKSEDHTVDLSFSDNGVGVPGNFNFRKQETLGLQSIFTIAEHQLQGTAHFKINKGIECNIKFNNALYAPRV